MPLSKDAGRPYRQREVSFKADSVMEDGRFHGYASVFGVVDSYNEIVAPGAFTESLERIKASGRTLPALWHHIASQPIGGYDSLTEDERGLRVEGFLLTDDIPQARVAYVTMKRNIVTGLSIGYYIEADSWNEKDRVRTLTKVDLVEVSVVTFPACDEARAEAVRAKLSRGVMPTIRELECLLLEQGFSRSQATAIADRGLKAMLPGNDLESSNAIGDALRQLRTGGSLVLPSIRR